MTNTLRIKEDSTHEKILSVLLSAAVLLTATACNNSNSDPLQQHNISHNNQERYQYSTTFYSKTVVYSIPV